MGFHSLLQGIFPTQRLNLGLLHCRQILYHLSSLLTYNGELISHDFMGQAGHMYWSGLAWLELDGSGCLVYMPGH